MTGEGRCLIRFYRRQRVCVISFNGLLSGVFKELLKVALLVQWNICHVAVLPISCMDFSVFPAYGFSLYDVSSVCKVIS